MENKAYTPEEYQAANELPKFDTESFVVNGNRIMGEDGGTRFYPLKTIQYWFDKNWPIISDALTRCATPSAGWREVTEETKKLGMILLWCEGIICQGMWFEDLVDKDGNKADSRWIMGWDWEAPLYVKPDYKIKWQPLPEPPKEHDHA